jgi:lipid-A-disaccharide synthase
VIALSVAFTLLREALRALGAPLRLLAYLPFRKKWRRLAAEALAASARPESDATAEDLVVDKLVERAVAGRRLREGGRRPRIFVSAGEASGDAHAARLCEAIADRADVVAFGGPLLQKAGALVRFPLAEHAVMGVVGVLRQLPLVLKAYATFLRILRDEPPDLVVLVDYPGLHLVMAKACKRARVPVLHYVAPQYWAWGPWRMRRYRRAVDATLTILPFETAFFAQFEVPARYIGHPLLDQIAASPPDAREVAAMREHPTLCLLPGSRRSEIEANLPGMLAAAAQIRSHDPSARVVVAHRDARREPLLREIVSQHAHGHEVEIQIGPLAPRLAGARLTLAKSGTGSLEACLFGNPVVVVYKLRSALASLGYHNILSVPFIAAANLVAGREVVPELCFHGQAGWQRVADAAVRLWTDDEARRNCEAGLAEVRRRLGGPGATTRVAAIVDAFFRRTAARP